MSAKRRHAYDAEEERARRIVDASGETDFFRPRVP
jgi:hypothetical protein